MKLQLTVKPTGLHYRREIATPGVPDEVAMV